MASKEYLKFGPVTIDLDDLAQFVNLTEIGRAEGLSVEESENAKFRWVRLGSGVVAALKELWQAAAVFREEIENLYLRCDSGVSHNVLLSRIKESDDRIARIAEQFPFVKEADDGSKE